MHVSQPLTLLALVILSCHREARAECDIAELQPGIYCAGNTTATPCPAGGYCPANDGSFVPCPINTFRAETGGSDADTACTACPPRTVTAGPGGSVCVNCGQGSLFVSDACVACPPGTYLASGDASACTLCATGNYNDGEGRTACRLCKPGSYSAVIGASACTQCSPGRYTFMTVSDPAVMAVATWGAYAADQCVPLKLQGDVFSCQPGTFMLQSTCVPCPVTHYCPIFSISDGQRGALRYCGDGKRSPERGAAAQEDCTLDSPLSPFVMSSCGAFEAPDLPELNRTIAGAQLRAAALSKCTRVVFLASAFAVYRVDLTLARVLLVAGAENEAGPPYDNTGDLARFSDITAMGIDLDAPVPRLVVVADGIAVRALDVYTRTVWLLGRLGDVVYGGGVAIRRTARGGRIAYVSDTTMHVVVAFEVDRPGALSRVVGGVRGTTGKLDGPVGYGSLNAPLGLSFLERDMNSSRMLLVADSGNDALRLIDTEHDTTTTWFASLDSVAPELRAPMHVHVALGTSTDSLTAPGILVYVTNGQGEIFAVQTPLAGIAVLSPVTTARSVAAAWVGALAPYELSGGDTFAFPRLIGLSTTSTAAATSSRYYSLFTLMHNSLVTNPDACFLPCGGSSSTCNLEPARLCGNGFLDAGEECDDGGQPGSGCSVADGNCTIRANFTCPHPLTTCESPCPGYWYGGRLYCANDCAALTPPPGYTINSTCGLVDVDECATAPSKPCDTLALCVNQPGSYGCMCKPPFFGNGFECTELAFAVYTVVDIPTYPPLTFASSAASVPTVLSSLLTAYAATLVDSVLAARAGTASSNDATVQTSNGYAFLVSQAGGGIATSDLRMLTRLHTSAALESGSGTATRLELVSLFATKAQADAAVGGTTVAGLSMRLSGALFGRSSGVTAIQPPKWRLHNARRASSIDAQNAELHVLDGWGMNVTGLHYNRLCPNLQAGGSGACWEIEMVYMGGDAFLRSDMALDPLEVNPASTKKQDMNVIYLPRVDRDPVTMDYSVPGQAIAMTVWSPFPCWLPISSTATAEPSRQSTVCCMRDFQSRYRVNSDFTNLFINSPPYVANDGVCHSGRVTDTAPPSDVVFERPSSSTNSNNHNDYVLGRFDNMPTSDVALLETIDYATRTFRVRVRIDERELQAFSSRFDGDIKQSYNATLFIGLASFRGTGTSTLLTRSMQTFLTFSKSNILTVSSYGASRGNLVTSANMDLRRVRLKTPLASAAGGFQVQYFFYLLVSIQVPKRFTGLLNQPIVPLNSLRVVRSNDGGIPQSDSPNWLQACSSTSGDYVFADADVRAAIFAAQQGLQECLPSDFQYLCLPPGVAGGMVTFSVPLPPSMFRNEQQGDVDKNGDGASDLFTDGLHSVSLQLMARALDTSNQAIVSQGLLLTIDLQPLGFQRICEGRMASQDLQDLVSGDIYVGVAESSEEWRSDSTMQRKFDVDAPGATPSLSFRYNASTVGGSIITFTALGTSSYFGDSQRGVGLSVNMHDIYTVHILEPKGMPTIFDSVLALYTNDQAFRFVTDSATHNAWLEPTAALLALCPTKSEVGRASCMTRADSTIRNNVLVVNDQSLSVVAPSSSVEVGSVGKLQALFARVFGSASAAVRNMGAHYHAVLTTQLQLNTRYRKAFVISPVFPAAPSNMVADKILAVGLITMHTVDSGSGRRRLLAAATTTAGSSTAAFERSYNVLLLSTNIAGGDSADLLCRLTLGFNITSCSLLQLSTRIQGSQNAQAVCAAAEARTLSLQLNIGVQTLRPPGGSVSLAQYTLNGCDSITQSPDTAVQITTNVLVSAPPSATAASSTTNSSSTGATLNLDTLRQIAGFGNATTWGAVLDGRRIVRFSSTNVAPDGHKVRLVCGPPDCVDFMFAEDDTRLSLSRAPGGAIMPSYLLTMLFLLLPLVVTG